MMGEEIVMSIGHKIDIAEGGQEALSLLEKNDYDLMITDLAMPNMSGDQLVEEVKEKYPDMTVVVLTGYGDSSVSLSVKMKKQGVRIFGKPFAMAKIEALLDEVANKDRKKKNNF